MESRASASTRLLFCTTGILMRRLQSDPQLRGYSHLILDEVHERQALGDFLLIVLRDLAVRQDLKLVLMSATVNAELFCGYFGNCPAFTIPGRFFPVQDYYLEDAMDATNHLIEEGSPMARRGSGPKFKRAAVEVSGRGGKTYTQQVMWEDESAPADGDEDPAWVDFMAELRAEGYRSTTITSLARVDETVINYDLIEDLLRYIVDKEPEMVENGDDHYRENGAVLIFLPGLGEIRVLLERLSGSRYFGSGRNSLILPLHSALSSAEQQRIFERPPRGVRKIILSTNIAEVRGPAWRHFQTSPN
jgi:HrpA-like RNA helicase